MIVNHQQSRHETRQLPPADGIPLIENGGFR